MGILNKLTLFLTIFLFLSCAKFQYLIEQGVGQVSIITKAKTNESVLKDVTVKKEYKDKIRKIIKYKKFFYDYFDRVESEIYSKTTFLDSKAVTYLVISSRYNKIKAHKECFPVMGCFPYIGFFKLDSAKEYKKKMSEEGFSTYLRPVYAYSTLGYFTDTILSSFFNYSDYDLAEVIFHELFHTIFFIKNEIDLNENLANFFGKKLTQVYFKLSVSKKMERDELSRKKRVLRIFVVKSVNDLNVLYKKSNVLGEVESKNILKQYLDEQFFKNVRGLCKKLKIKENDCFPLKIKWNNASFAAYMTYEKKIDKVIKLEKDLKVGLRGYLKHLESSYKEFQDKNIEGEFSDYLFLNKN